MYRLPLPLESPKPERRLRPLRCRRFEYWRHRPKLSFSVWALCPVFLSFAHSLLPEPCLLFVRLHPHRSTSQRSSPALPSQSPSEPSHP
jgi:hypothetical protein